MKEKLFRTSSAKAGRDTKKEAPGKGQLKFSRGKKPSRGPRRNLRVQRAGLQFKRATILAANHIALRTNGPLNR
jgi:hypothetical protein